MSSHVSPSGLTYSGSGWASRDEFILAASDPLTREVFRVALDQHGARHLRDRLSRFLEGADDAERALPPSPPTPGVCEGFYGSPAKRPILQQAMTDF